jgi:hypothetical protein
VGRFDDISAPGENAVEDERAERGRELVAAAVAATSAPPALRERLERERERATPARRHRRRSLGLAGASAAVVAAVLAALVITFGGAGAAPSVLATVQLAGGGPTLPAPRPDASNPSVLDAGDDGLPFPEWNTAFRWRAAGMRRDDIGGRRAMTVYYDDPRGTRAAYTILEGDAIDAPAGARTVRIRYTVVHVLRRGSQRIVVWDRAGHTCVMSAPASVPEDRLIRLAAWDGGGVVPF